MAKNRLSIVNDLAVAKGPNFCESLESSGVSTARREISTVQMNIGKLCNMACLHCHVEAGPKRTELMSKETIDRILELLSQEPDIELIDITGGAPEMNPHFRYLVEEARGLRRNVIDRCNLTILLEPGYEDLGQFLAEHEVQIVASLPCYTEENTDKQRGTGSFDSSIKALQLLNSLGYGTTTTRKLDLVYNPTGPTLPPPQHSLEREYKERLRSDYGIVFNSLYTITNMPIKRFTRQLKNWGRYDSYMELLHQSFNPEVADAVMCKSLISISYDGKIYDCDFNQMLDLAVPSAKNDIWTIESFSELAKDPIAFGAHCYGCTAGCGSSCSGSLT